VLLLAINEDVPSPQLQERRYVKTYMVDRMNTSRTPEEGARTLSWPNGRIVIINIIIIINSDSVCAL
jgi:hypothetical protein